MPHYSAETYRARGSIGYLVRRAGNLMVSRIEAVFASHEITFVQWVVLMYVRDGISRTAADICRDMCHDSGALTRVIDHLSDRGLIERRRSTEDRRIIELFLTDEGCKTVQSLIPLVVDNLNTVLGGFGTTEVEALTGLLTKLIDAIQAMPKSCALPQTESVP